LVEASTGTTGELELVVRRSRGRERTWHAPRQAALLAIALFALAGAVGGIDSSAVGPAALPDSASSGCSVSVPYRNAFHAAARDTRLPYALLVALGVRESRLNPVAHSHLGAQGLLQVLPSTARDLRLDPMVPRTNILAGARYLRRMLDRFGGDLDLALAAYNAGPEAVIRAGGAPDGPTLTYVANVRGTWHDLRTCR
jgi:soluble lytic murein transglycosylase-like protein